MKTLLILMCMMPLAGAQAEKVPQPGATRETVVLLHGIGHSRWNMYGIERRLRREGYDLLNLSYPSLKHDIGALSHWLEARLEQANIWSGGGKVHFVTHSMGGLVVGRYLAHAQARIPPAKMGRVVMIAPPNGGSEIADFLKDFPPYRWVFGPAGQELTTAARAREETPVWYEAGIIAGTRGWLYPEALFLIRGEHDGRVSTKRAKLPGMRDFITVPATHSFISWRRDVQGLILGFLRDGKFSGPQAQRVRQFTPPEH